tara:strand:- start:14150 stop:14848 length:699 start_codon:yes stop_codon:yes gene_type:complete
MPTIKTISSPWPRALKKEETENWAPAKSEAFATLAGRNRWLNEFLRGEFYTDRSGSLAQEAPATPANPQGITGLDHSGPPYGPALRHSVAQYHAIKYASGTSPLNDDRGIEVPPDEGITFPVAFYNKPFSPSTTAPHSMGNLHVRIFNESGAASTMSFRIRGAGADKSLTTASVGNNSAATTLFNGSSDRFPIASGQNLLSFTVTRSSPAGAGTFYLLAWDIGILGKTGLYP